MKEGRKFDLKTINVNLFFAPNPCILTSTKIQWCVLASGWLVLNSQTNGKIVKEMKFWVTLFVFIKMLIILPTAASKWCWENTHISKATISIQLHSMFLFFSQTFIHLSDLIFQFLQEKSDVSNFDYGINYHSLSMERQVIVYDLIIHLSVSYLLSLLSFAENYGYFRWDN